jgi:hypothetical protein
MDQSAQMQDNNHNGIPQGGVAMALMMVQETTEIVPIKVRYIQEIQQTGFLQAHRAMLHEIKFWLDHDPAFCGSPVEAIREAVRLHTRLVFMAAFSNCPLPSVEEIDHLFVEVFGDFSRSVLNQPIQ